MAKGKHQTQRKTGGSVDKKKLIIIVAVVLATVALAVTAVVLLTRDRGEEPAQPGAPGDTLPDDSGTLPDTPEEPVQSDTSPDTPDAPEVPETPVEPEPETPPEPEYIGPWSPLTGLPVEEDLSGYRPFAVMMNNIKKSTPQSGIRAADILLEAPVEGGITRFMGIFQDFKDVQAVGSVRSARPYYVDIALGFDAVYIHAGGSNDAYGRLMKSGIEYIDGVNGSGECFYRDPWRKANMGLTHSLMLDLTKLDEYIQRHGIDTLHTPGYQPPFTFEETERTGDPAKSVTVYYGASEKSKTTTFAYDETTKLYAVSQYDGPMTDMDTQEQLSFRNVLILRAPISVIPGDDAGRLQAKLTGSGAGSLIVDGVSTYVTWTRSDDDDPFTLAGPGGAPVSLAPGTTFIALVPTSAQDPAIQ